MEPAIGVDQTFEIFVVLVVARKDVGTFDAYLIGGDISLSSKDHHPRLTSPIFESL